MTLRIRTLTLALVAVGAAVVSYATLDAQQPQAAARVTKASAPAAVTLTPGQQKQFFAQYCVGCHNERNKAAVRNLALDNIDVAAAGQHGEIWEKVIKKLRAGQMPPAAARRPERALSDQVATWLETELDRTAATRPNPGRTETLHRLNRTEYHNVVRDLLGLDIDVEDLLPPDPLGGGDANFDNIASSLRMNQGLLEQYLSTARKVARTTVGGTVPVAIQTFKPASGLRQDIRLDGMPFGTRGGLAINYAFPLDGIYEVAVAVAQPGAFATGSSGKDQLDLSLDGEQVKVWDITPPARGTRPKPFTIQMPVKAGQRQLIATFTKSEPTVELAGDRLPFVGGVLPGNPVLPSIDSVTVSGPVQVAGKGDTPSRRKILTCTPHTAAEEEPCAKRIVTTLARRGLRRPVTDADTTFLMNFYKEGRVDADFEGGIERAIRALLVSPEFLYRIESDPANVTPGGTYRIDDLELASRMSFFIWSSIPDDELLDLGVRGQLKNPAVLDQQVRRMLRDKRSGALTKSFGSFYLWIRNVADQTPAETVYPNFDQTLREALAKETELFFDSIRSEDRSVIDLLNANYTFVNERLALHYGIPGIRGADFRRVMLSDDSPRRGILGKGSILLVTSVPQRTSPVKRGKWILDNVLGTPPPPPPANVPPLGDQKQNDGRILTMREMMQKHRANPVCASCHSVIDPVGFALEQFDATGKWREVDASFAKIDPAGQMPDGSKFGNLADFRRTLVSHPEPFVRTFTEKLMVYALGRGFEYYDAPAVRKVLRETAKENYKFSSVVLGIVRSAPFQMRRAPSNVATGVSASR